MVTRTRELRELARQLAEKLAGTEHEDIAVRAALLAHDLAGDVELAYHALDRLVMPALRPAPGPVAPAPPSAG